MKLKTLLLAGSAAIASTVLSAPALAQSADASAPSSGDTSTQAETGSQVIVVTAQRREERLQDVPISLAVLGGEQLDVSTAQGVTEALSRVPGVSVNIASQSGGTQLTVRGVSASGPLFSGSTPVAFYLDTVPFALVKSAIAPDPAAYDLARVEVLRGPQGTLYGASALNGVIRVLTHQADLDAFEAKGRFSVAGTRHGGGSYRADAALNVPLVPGAVAVRAVIGYQDLSGWIDKPNAENVNDYRALNARLRLDARPTDALTISLTSWFSRADQGSPNSSDDSHRNFALLSEPISTDFDSYGLSVSYDFGGLTATSSTSYLRYASTSFIDRRIYTVPNNRLETSLDSRVFTEELVLNSSGTGPWRWSLGGIYRNAKDDQFQSRPDRIIPAGSGQVVPIVWTDRSRSYAVYGELTRLLFDDRLELTGGLRYFHDQVRFNERVKSDGSTNPLFVRDSEFEAATPRAALTWHVSRDLNFYGSYSQGFRSGFDQNPPTLAVAPEFGPVTADRLHNYEIGSKGRFANGLLAFDVAFFYIDWNDVQQLLVIPAFGSLVSAVVNAGSANGWGADLSLTARPTRGLELGASYGWNALEFAENVDFFGGRFFNEGERLSYSPEHTLSVFGDYSFRVGNDLEATIALSGNYTSQQTNRSLIGGAVSARTGDELFIARGSISIGANDRWTARLFADNIFDEDGTVLPVPAGGRPDDATRIRPRTIGAQLELRF